MGRFADSIACALDVAHEEEQLRFRIEAMLREKGWKHTCETPGSYWLWEREFNGRVFLLERDMAVAIQKSIEVQAIDASDEVDDG